MIRTCQCPSCGAKVDFRASSTLLAVCEYCQSTLIRTDVDVENIGKMADLLPDSSLLQIGSNGKYKTSQFSVIGRVQYQYESGIWNEWHLLFDNGKTGWLSEASGNFVITFLRQNSAPTNPLKDYQVDAEIEILGERLIVTGIENASCIAGQGELPFKVNTGFDVTVVDLSNEKYYASLDFSETPPLLFVGESVELKALALSNLRDATQLEAKTTARRFNCPSCAAPVQALLSDSKTISCSSCSAVLDIANKNVKILLDSENAQKNQAQPLIPIGSVGQFDDIDYTVIGYLRQQSAYDGISYYWDEYLLHNPADGFKWLIASQGHWTYAHTIKQTPRIRNQKVFLEKEYKHFANYNAKVIQVTGEFYWRIKINTQTNIDDFVNPPHILSREKITKETTWTVGEYKSPNQIEQAFNSKIKLSSPSGIGANQPSPYENQTSEWFKTMFYFIFAAFVLQLIFSVTSVFSSGRVLLNTNVTFSDAQKVNPTPSLTPAQQADLDEYRRMLVNAYGPSADDSAIQSRLDSYKERLLSYSYNPANTYTANSSNSTYQSPVFTVTGHSTNLIIKQNADLTNTWLATDVTMIEQSTGKIYHAQREASYYSGYDDGESWSEGDKKNEIMFGNIPIGNYYIKIDANSEWTDTSSPSSYAYQSNQYSKVIPPIYDHITVIRDTPHWSNFWALAFLLSICPFVAFYLRSRFERQRWAESDYAES